MFQNKFAVASAGGLKKFLALLAVFIFMAGCGEEEQAITKFKEFTPNEEIGLKSVDGKELTLIRKNNGFVIKGEEAKTVMFDIFGTFCPPCQKEAPELTEYQVKNAENFKIIALTHFENVTDEYVIDQFMKKYQAYYFIANDQSINDRLAEQIAQDIGYKRELALPFKVVLQDGAYQELTDVDSGKFGVKYYLGGIKMGEIRGDLAKINAKLAR